MTQPASADLFGRLRGAIESYPQRLTEATREVGRITRTVVTGRSVDGMVEVEVAGDGTVVAVYLPSARWGIDSQTLAEDVTQAVNAALDAVDDVRDALVARLSGPQPAEAGSAAEELFQHRMDALASRIDGLEGRIGTGSDAEITPAGSPVQGRLRSS